MITIYSTLDSLIKLLKNNANDFDCRSFLEASTFAKEYEKTIRSIYWNDSPERVKKVVRTKLHKYCYLSYSAFVEGTNELNNYAELKGNIKAPKWWYEVLVCMVLIEGDYNKHYSKYLTSLQLELDFFCNNL